MTTPISREQRDAPVSAIPPNVGEPTPEARKGVCRAWAQILRDQHPGVSWNVRPVERGERDAPRPSQRPTPPPASPGRGQGEEGRAA